MATGHEFVRYLAAQANTRTERAEYNSASRGLELAQIRERAAEVISQHQPLAGLGLARSKVEALLVYVVQAARYRPGRLEGGATMKRLALTLVALTLNGCATIMNDQRTAVTVLSDPPGAEYTVTNRAGAEVARGVTPGTEQLNASAGYFRPEKYRVQYATGETTRLDARLSGWYVPGLLLSLIGGLIIDPLTGDMWTLPEEVRP